MQSGTNGPSGAGYVSRRRNAFTVLRFCNSQQANSFKDRQEDIPYIALSVSSPRWGSLPMDLTDDFCPPRPDTADELHAAVGLRVVVCRSYKQLGFLNLMSALACILRRLIY
jgi:hypothetical protein